jgi:hypothetical protein
MNKFTIKLIDAEQTLEIRQKVMWPNKSIDYVNIIRALVLRKLIKLIKRVESIIL